MSEGVHRVKPRTREERRALSNADEVQKYRLSQRKEGFSSYENPGDLVKPGQGAPGHIDEATRFNTDVQELVVDDQRARREKNEAVLQRKRRVEEGRLAAIDSRVTEAQRKEEERLRFLKEADYGKKNKSGAAYNPLTLEYGDGQDGDRLRWEDENAVWRAQMRSHNLDARGNSSYNPLTGEERAEPSVMPKPAAPQWMGQR